MEYEFWKVEYNSCEGNYRWAIARTPADWEQWQVEQAVPIGGMGDDVAELIGVIPTIKNEDYLWDFKN